MPHDGFVTRISHDLYRRLAGDTEHDAELLPVGAHVLEHKPGMSRWHWLQDAMRRSIEQARAEAQEHREIAEAQRFVLDRIEFAPEDEALRQRLERFMREFDSASRVAWVRRIWPTGGRDGIVLDALQDVCLSAREAIEADEDAYERALWARTAQEAGGTLAVRFLGSWRERPMDTSATQPAAGAEPSGPVQATLLIRDALGQRAVEMRTHELTLGTAGDVPVRGKYVSRRHLRLFVEDGRLWVVDNGSTNGAWTGEGRLASGEPCEIRDHAELRLGAALAAIGLAEEECPRVVVTRVVARTGVFAATPVLERAPSTPVLAESLTAAPEPLLTLTLVASGWRREVPIHRLPVTVGRSHSCELCLPEENAAVSGCHLRLVELELPEGVWVEDLGSTRGSYLGGRRSSGRFLLPLGQILTLGGTRVDERHRPVQLCARQPAGGPA